jgi:hypothetical protein
MVVNLTETDYPFQPCYRRHQTKRVLQPQAIGWGGYAALSPGKPKSHFPKELNKAVCFSTLDPQSFESTGRVSSNLFSITVAHNGSLKGRMLCLVQIFGST